MHDTIATFPCISLYLPLTGNGCLCIRSSVCRYVIYNRPKQGPASKHHREFSAALDDLSLTEMPPLPESGHMIETISSSEANMSTDPAEAPTENLPKQSKAKAVKEGAEGTSQPEKEPEWGCQIDAATGMLSRYALNQEASFRPRMRCTCELSGNVRTAELGSTNARIR
jgi:hypothetical protein